MSPERTLPGTVGLLSESVQKRNIHLYKNIIYTYTALCSLWSMLIHRYLLFFTCDLMQRASESRCGDHRAPCSIPLNGKSMNAFQHIQGLVTDKSLDLKIQLGVRLIPLIPLTQQEDPKFKPNLSNL